MVEVVAAPQSAKQNLKLITVSLLVIPILIGIITGLMAGFADIMDLQVAVQSGIVAAVAFGIPYVAILLATPNREPE